MTNYEKIKNMSIEEMAEILVIEIDGAFPCKAFGSVVTGSIMLSQKSVLDENKQWLESEAEE